MTSPNEYVLLEPGEVAGLDEDDDIASPFQKIGTKKLRKMKEKAERKVKREVCVISFVTF